MGLFRQPSWSRSRISLHRRQHRDSSAPPSPTPPLPPSLIHSPALSRQLSLESNTYTTQTALTNTNETFATTQSTTPEPAEAEIMTAIPGSYIKSESLGLSTTAPAPLTPPTASPRPLMGPSPASRSRSLSTGYPSPSYGNPRPLGAPVSPRLSPRPSPHLSPQPRPLMPPGDEEISPPDSADTCHFSPSDLGAASRASERERERGESIPYLLTNAVDMHPEFTTGDMLLLAGGRGFRCHSGLLRAWSGAFVQQTKSDRFLRERMVPFPDSAEEMYAILSFLYGTERQRAHINPPQPAGGLGLYGTLPSIQVEDAGFSVEQFGAILDFADRYDVLPALRDLIQWQVDADAKRLCANRPGGIDVAGLVRLAHRARSAGLWKELVRRAWPKPDGIGYRPPAPEWRVMTHTHTLSEAMAERLGGAQPLLLLVGRVHSATGFAAVSYEKVTQDKNILTTAIVTGGKDNEFKTTMSV